MATVFLSYDHDDADRAGSIAAALEKAGHSVWWDRHIQGGAEYNNEIEAAVEQADAVVVLWSERSIHSTWVRDEAAEGRDQGKLVPVLISAVKPPMGFRQFQAIDLSRSGRAPGSDLMRQILAAIDRVGGVSQPRQMAPAEKQPTRRRLVERRMGIAVAALAVLAVAATVGWVRFGSPNTPVVAVAPSDSTSRSQALSRELFVKLGTYSHVGGSKWRLADLESAPSDPDLLFRAAESGASGQAKVSLVLLDGRRDNLLWSREFTQSGAEADLRLQVALAAGVALVCALEGREAGGLPPDLFKRYLSSCAEAAEISETEPDKIAGAMRVIIAQQPRFTPAWAMLLAAQSNVVAVAQIDEADLAAAHRQTLRKDIANARRVAPDLPEIKLAELELLSPFDYAGALDRLARAKALAPDKAGNWAAESFWLMHVGRMWDARNSAKRAAELEPLSPSATGQMIMSLAHGGQIEAARKELAQAERKWAGTAALRDMQWAFHLRYGDPKIAMSLRGPGANLYLRARLDPTPQNVGAMEADIERASADYISEFSYAITALAEFDKTDEVFRWLNRIPPEKLAASSYVLFRPAMDDVRRDKRFIEVAKRIGLVGYWQKSGKWPDFCYQPALPYDCQQEASKLADRA